MALVYANLEAFPVFQERIEGTIRRLEEEARSREEQITKAAAILNRRVEAANRAQIAAEAAYQNAQMQLAAAEQRTRDYNSNLADDQSPMTTSMVYYDNVSWRRDACDSARDSVVQAQQTLDGFETYARHHMQSQEQAVEEYRKLLMRSKTFFHQYMQLLITAKKYTAVSSAGGSQDQSGYTSPYAKTTYTGAVTYTDPGTKQSKTVNLNRTVYQNRNIDPNRVIPAGTPMGRGKFLDRDMTNLELMESGSPPFVTVRGPDGSESLSQVVLHHVTGQETIHGSKYFTGTEKDGSIVEIPAALHQRFDRTLHINHGPGSSFRFDKKKDPQTDERVKVTTEDNKKYARFYSRYWKDRAAAIRAAGAV